MENGLWSWSSGKPWRLCLMLAVCILAILWPLTTFQTTLKWDALDISLPWRYFVCDALRNGVLPLWNPFQFQGFAQGTEPQTWYLPAILLGLLRGYGLYSLNLEYLLHLIIAAIGFHRLASSLGIKKAGLGWGALIFAVSGFFIGNAQHIGWIVAGAWIPHLLASYRLFLQKREARDLVYVALFCYLLVSGGYLAYSIVMAYGLAVWTLFHYIRKLHNSEKTSFRYDLLRLLALIGLACGAVLVGMWDLSEHISRSTGLSNTESMVGSLRFKHLLSWLFPYPTVFENITFWKGDQSIINLYMSLPGFILMLGSLRLIKQDKRVRTWWLFLLGALALSLGEELPFRLWANNLPLLELFRFPSLFRYFVVLFGCLLAVRNLNHMLENRQRRHVLPLSLGIGTTYLVALIYSVSAGFDLPAQNAATAFGVQALIGIAILATGAFFLSKANNSERCMSILVALTFFELLLFVNLNGPTSVYSPADFRAMQSSIEALPQGYPHPPLFDALSSNSDRSLKVGGLYRNTGMLYKRFTWDGYTPYQYHGFLQLEESERYQRVLAEGPLILSARKVKRINSDFHDSYPLDDLKSSSLQILEFDPNQIKLKTSTELPRLLIYNQNFHPSWKAFVDGKQVPMHKSDVNLLSIHLPFGEHTVAFEFRPGSLVNALYISAATLLLILFYLLGSKLNAIYFLVVAGVYALLFIMGRRTAVSPPTDREAIHLVNAYHSISDSNAMQDRFLDRSDLNRLRQYISNAPPQSQVAHQPNAFQPSVTAFLKSQSGQIDSTNTDGWHLFRLEKKPESLCTFDGPSPNWINAFEDLKADDRGNNFQDCSKRTYSASFNLQYQDTGLKAIAVSAKVRGDSDRAQLVISAEGPDGTRTRSTHRVRKILPDHSEWSTIQVQKAIPAHSLPIHIKVYLWNPRQEPIEIDDFSVVLKKS